MVVSDQGVQGVGVYFDMGEFDLMVNFYFDINLRKWCVLIGW